MSDGAPFVQAGIDYPDFPPPGCGDGSATAIGHGVHWLRMPLFTDSAAINCWAIEDGDEWVVIDSGIHDDKTVAAWQLAANELMGGRGVGRVFATHMHPDHAGMAGWLSREHGATLHMTRLEYLTLRMFEGSGEEATRTERAFYLRAGMPEEWLAEFKGRAVSFSRAISAVPGAYGPLGHGDTVRIGDGTWECVVGHGHSPEHACFWNREVGVLISGDQVLPAISSNVSVLPTEPGADPLSDWIASLSRIREIVPDDVLVLPAHGEPFRGLHARIDALIMSHERKLTRLVDALREARRATDLFSVLFRKVPENFMYRSLATGEALAHLACLQTRGLIGSFADENDVVWWQKR